MTSRTRLIMAFMIILTLAVGCGTPAPTPTTVLQPTQTSPPPTDSTPTAVLQPTQPSPPPTEPPPLPPTAVAPTEPPTLPPTTQAPTDTPQPPATTATPVPHAESAPRGAQVTFVNNAGFLITVGDRKILIDALYRGEPVGVLNSVAEARPPFDAIDLILVTHDHPDHFSPDRVASAMSHSPEAILVSSQRVVERLLVVDDSLQDRAIPIQLQAGESEQLDVNGIGLEALYISHGDPNLLNLGFVITVGDVRFFHTGDNTAGDITVAYLQSYGLPEMQLDVAFVPYFYLTTERYHAYALEGIQARYVIPMHYETRNPPLGVEDDFPNAIVFHDALERWMLPLAAEATHMPPTDTPLRPTETPSPATLARVIAQLEGLPIDEFFDESFRQLQLRDPDTLISNGLGAEYGVEKNDRFSDSSDRYLRETQQLESAILDLLRGYDRSALSSEGQLSYDIYEWVLDDLVRQQEFMYYNYPINSVGLWDTLTWVISLMVDSHPIASQQDAADYVARLSQIDTWVEQLLEGLELREQAGVIPPRFLVQRSIDQIGLHLGEQGDGSFDAQAIQLYTAFREKLEQTDSISAEQRQALLDAALTEIEDTVIPALLELREYLAYLETIASDVPGVHKFPKGEAFYNYVLHYWTGTDLSADQVHELGLAEVARIQAEMRATAAEMGYPADISMAELDAIFSAESDFLQGDALKVEYERLIAEADQAMEGFFDLRPSAEVIVRYDPAAPPAYYQVPPRDGPGPGLMVANLANSAQFIFYNPPVLVHHETIPGHHVQFALAQELDLPTRFQRDLIFDVYRQHLPFEAYTEGWAFYAEGLAWEMGLYEGDPLNNLGRLRLRLHRTARMVVDTGIHAKGWTVQEAIDYLEEATGAPYNQNRLAQIIAVPGQACGYNIGMLKILELRQRAMDQLGDEFDIKAFHNVILGHGPMPLEILERVVDDWIAAGGAAESVSSNTPVAQPPPGGGGRIAFASMRDGTLDIYVMDADSGNVTRLTNDPNHDSGPVWSPDGTRIAFMSERSANHDIYVMDADGSNVARLTTDPADEHGAAWSPDGARIAFTSNRSGNLDIYVVDADGSNVTRLTNNPADDTNVAWSPDGAHIAFSSDRDGDLDIYVMDADGSNVTRLTDNLAQDVDPAWSPDGTQVVFVSNRDSSDPASYLSRDNNWEIYTMDVDGSNAIRLTDHPAYDIAPRWSPDGGRIIFVSMRDGEMRIYVMDADGSNQARLTRDSAMEETPAWSP